MLRDTQFRWSPDGGSHLIVTGEIDFAVVRPFREALNAAIERANSPAFVDMTGVTFFDSSGINTLVHAKRVAERRGVDLVIDPSPCVRRVLEVVHLDQDFTVD